MPLDLAHIDTYCDESTRIPPVLQSWELGNNHSIYPESKLLAPAKGQIKPKADWRAVDSP